MILHFHLSYLSSTTIHHHNKNAFAHFQPKMKIDEEVPFWGFLLKLKSYPRQREH
jgi:hypothetical protein